MNSALALAWLVLAAGMPGTPSPVVFVRATENVAVRPGESVEARISVRVSEGYHVQANPASADYLVATRLKLKSLPGIIIRKVTYPPGRPYRLEGTDDDLQTYEGSFDIIVSLTVSGSARSGRRTLAGQLEYQACNSKTCLFPASVPVTIPLVVLPRKADASSTRPMQQDRQIEKGATHPAPPGLAPRFLNEGTSEGCLLSVLPIR